jgi:prepilin-type N-terminal cleavage/methylation domain-containing protein
MTKAFTLIELLLVIALIAIIVAMSTPFLSRMVMVNQLKKDQELLLSSLHKAQSYAMDNKDGQSWGVCLSGNQMRLYSNSCSNPNFNESFSLSNNISISGLSDVQFNQRGEPNNIINISINSSLATNNISINQAGIIEAN